MDPSSTAPLPMVPVSEAHRELAIDYAAQVLTDLLVLLPEMTVATVLGMVRSRLAVPPVELPRQ